MRDLTLNEVALADAHVAMDLGLVSPDRFVCHLVTCSCGRRYCSNCMITSCETCRLRADIVTTLKVEFDVEISAEKASEGVALYERNNLSRFCKWISQFDRRAPLAYAPMVA